MSTDLSTLDKISMIVERYQKVPADFRDIETLTTWNRKLACCLFDYAGEVGDLYKSGKGAEYERRTLHERERLRLMSEGKSAAAADGEAKAGVQYAAALLAEFAADGDYKAAQMQLSAARDVLEAMRQHIASLKMEQRLEMTGQGSQH